MAEIILALATLVAAVTGAIISLRNAFTIKAVKEQINSRQDQWVQAAVAAAVAAALALERQRVQDKDT